MSDEGCNRIGVRSCICCPFVREWRGHDYSRSHACSHPCQDAGLHELSRAEIRNPEAPERCPLRHGPSMVFFSLPDAAAK